MAINEADRYGSARTMRAALNECGVDQTTHVSTPDDHGASRRIDVAAPSRAEVGRQIDLLVQVRFEASTRLGLEDWPARVRPTEIEQVSEALQLDYPTDPKTGGLLPARLRIKLVAPDFRVDGQADRLIEVPPDAYSKRLAFLLSPLRSGSCRINVEVYGLDDLFLGAVPVEIVAVAGAVSEQEICVGNLVLEVVARQVAALLLGARIAAAPSPAPLAACRRRVGRDHNAQFLSADSGGGSISNCGRSRGVRAIARYADLWSPDGSRRSSRAVPQEAVVACGAGDSTARGCRVRGRCVADDPWRASDSRRP